MTTLPPGEIKFAPPINFRSRYYPVSRNKPRDPIWITTVHVWMQFIIQIEKIERRCIQFGVQPLWRHHEDLGRHPEREIQLGLLHPAAFLAFSLRLNGERTSQVVDKNFLIQIVCTGNRKSKWAVKFAPDRILKFLIRAVLCRTTGWQHVFLVRLRLGCGVMKWEILCLGSRRLWLHLGYLYV